MNHWYNKVRTFLRCLAESDRPSIGRVIERGLPISVNKSTGSQGTIQAIRQIGCKQDDGEFRSDDRHNATGLQNLQQNLMQIHELPYNDYGIIIYAMYSV